VTSREVKYVCDFDQFTPVCRSTVLFGFQPLLDFEQFCLVSRMFEPAIYQRLADNVVEEGFSPLQSSNMP